MDWIWFDFRDRFRTFTNVLGDSLGAGIVHHLSEKELAAIPHPDSPRKREPDIEFDSPASADLEKGEPTNGMPSQKNPTNVTSASVEVEWQSTSMWVSAETLIWTILNNNNNNNYNYNNNINNNYNNNNNNMNKKIKPTDDIHASPKIIQIKDNFLFHLLLCFCV